MNLPRLTPAQRDAMMRLARERRASGLDLLGEGLDRYARARCAGDDGALTGATAGMRECIDRLERGQAALRSLERGAAADAVALAWLRSQMALPNGAQETARGRFGLS